MAETDIDPSYSLSPESSPAPEELRSSLGRSSPEPGSSNEDDDMASDAHIISEPNSDVSASRSSTRQKRPSEDWTQFATSTARSKKLCSENRESLLTFSSLDQTERDIVLCAGILKVHERLDKIQPVEAAFEVPDGLVKFIDLKAFDVIMRPDLSAYISKDHPVELITNILIKKESWGIPSIKDDPKKWRVVLKCVRKRLTSWRYVIKKAIDLSIGTPSDEAEGPVNSDAIDILELCRDIKSKHKNAHEKEPNIEMLGRIAFVRHAHNKYSKSTVGAKSKDSKDAGFWKYVDKELEKLRHLHNNDDKKISQVFLKILNADQRLYGSVELPSSKAKH